MKKEQREGLLLSTRLDIATMAGSVIGKLAAAPRTKSVCSAGMRCSVGI